MKLLIIGGVAAGTKAAAKAKRMDRTAEVTLITKGRDISYAGCGLPYYIGGLIETREELIVNSPKKFTALTGVEVITETEVFSVDPTAHTLQARDLRTGTVQTHSYDKLVIATGASPVVPPLPGKDQEGVFSLRTPDDAVAIRDYLKKGVRKAVVVGAGFIGLEVAENLKAQGVEVTVVDLASQVLPNLFDPEMAALIKKNLGKEGIRVHTGVKAQAILGGGTVTGLQTETGTIPCEMLVMCVGIRPNTAFLQDTGIAMDRGTIVVNDRMATNVADIYAAGDCALVKNRLTGTAQWSAMGSSANMEGRTLSYDLFGGDTRYPGVLGTGVVKLPGMNCGRTGLTEAQAAAAGYSVVTAITATDDKAHYYPGFGTVILKLIADAGSHKLLGMQVLGNAVDKFVDVAVMALNMGATLEAFENADFSYAPPFSTAISPLTTAAGVLLNKISGAMKSITPMEYLNGKAAGYRVIETTPLTGMVRGAMHLDVTTVNGPVDGLKLDDKLLLVCTRGKRAYLLQNRLVAAGYTNTAVLEGGLACNDVHVENVSAAVSAADITRVKALGFLHDKRTPDLFNGRVITRNGKITAEEHKVIAEAAAKFGSGEITMTTRLTLEIQDVPYDSIEPLREFLAQAGLETGGTGSKVRPVVSCKGTTCQYGLIDTFDLSQKIHERFFEGYAGVKLPHKFKIAVGGCPNNCVKPNLNDVGIVGQRIPSINLDLCRGCKKCQIETGCPIHVAKVVDGKITIDPNACNHCGRCVGKCPFHAITEDMVGYRIYIGGRWGKKVAEGRALEKVFATEEEALNVVEKALLLFREQGITGERFADTINRIGFENVQAQLMSDELLQRKQENLQAQKHLKGGATC